jgi:hypothetical protein
MSNYASSLLLSKSIYLIQTVHNFLVSTDIIPLPVDILCIVRCFYWMYCFSVLVIMCIMRIEIHVTGLIPPHFCVYYYGLYYFHQHIQTKACRQRACKWLISKSKSTDSLLIRILFEYTKVYLYTNEYNMYCVMSSYLYLPLP